MANIPVVDGEFKLVQNIEGAGTVTATLDTENTFVDKDIKIETVTPRGSHLVTTNYNLTKSIDSAITSEGSSWTPSTRLYFRVSANAVGEVTTGGWLNAGDQAIGATSNDYYSIADAVLGTGTGTVSASSEASILGTATSTQPSSGYYITVSGSGSVGVTTAGYIPTTASASVNIANVYYPLQEAVLSITGGALSKGSGSTSLASDGLSNGTTVDSTKKIALTETNANGYYELQSSGSGSVTRAKVTKQATTAGYIPADSSAVDVIAQASQTSNVANKKYYVKQSTLSASSITPSTTQQTVTIGEGYYHETRTVTISAMTGGTITTLFANTGMSTYFNSGTSSNKDVSITPQYTNTAGYFDAHSSATNAGGVSYYKIKAQTVTEGTTTVSGTTATRGTRAESVGWKATAETLDVATFANEATSGKTYVDISATTAAPVLISGGYLFINKGWTDYLKISLARLVPDGSDVKGHSEYILSGHSAYDDDGTLVAGSIPTYAGAYTIS